MRISVLGNSDTSGRHLAPGETAWPALVQERLETALGEPITVDSWRFAPYRPGAAAYALGLVAEAEPDFVVIPLASYWCAFTTVQRSVELRFGARAAKLYTRAETAYRRRFERDGGSSGVGASLARRITRKALGAAPLLTVAQFIELYTTLIRELSHREDLQVIVFGDHAFSSGLREVMPGIGPAITRIEAAIKPLVFERRLQWADLEATIRNGGRREEMLLGDGIHMTPEAHERVAAMLTPMVARSLHAV